MEDLDEEARARRKKEQVEYRNKKRTSTTFMIFASIFEIVETFLVILILIILGLLILTKVLPSDSSAFSNVLGVMLIVLSIVGLVIGFIIYKKVIQWVIKKFNFEDKLLDEVKVHYIKKTEEEKEMELKK